MGDLIWVGNTLFPRSTVILAAILIILAIGGAAIAIRIAMGTGNKP